MQLRASRRVWVAAGGAVLLVAVSLGALTIWNDHAAVTDLVEMRTSSMARMMIAHAEVALDDAEKVLKVVDEPLRRWDLADEVQGRALFRDLRALVAGSRHLSSAWVMDGAGQSRLDSWRYPANPIDGSERPYFKAHIAGAAEPVIMGDLRAGGVTGKERFTISRTQRNPDGSIRAVMVVAIYSAYFKSLYEEVARWPDAHARLYSGDSNLARLRERLGSPAFEAEVLRTAQASPKGSGIMDDEGEAQLVSWQRSTSYPQLYSVVVQPPGPALAAWRTRSFLTALAVILGSGLFTAVLFFASRASAARDEARMHEMMTREVHHRVKNSLQVIAGLLDLRRRQSHEESVTSALEDVSGQIASVAKIHELLQSSRSLDQVDVSELIATLAKSLSGLKQPILFDTSGPILLEASRATPIALIVNELATNAVKHARERIAINCERVGPDLHIVVSNDGPKLPSDFEIGATAKRFGLRTASRIAAQFGGELKHLPERPDAAFRLRFPITAEHDAA